MSSISEKDVATASVVQESSHCRREPRHRQRRVSPAVRGKTS